ncbi:MAG TPA: LLM class flavin-dependent oxidoreductase [Methyloceanibacter sp.]
MEFGVWLPVYGGWLRVAEERRRPVFTHCQDVARCAEANGFNYVYASENYLNCVYGSEHQVADVWVYLSAIAATTSRIHLIGGLKPGFLSPFVMAHMVSSLDWVSGGRTSLNVVCGWWRQEFEHCGVELLDHDGRYRRATEYVSCLKGLWTESPFSFKGEYYKLNEVVLAGRVLERPHPSFWISGHSDHAVELAATEGDVLFVNGMAASELASFASKAKRAAAAHGRKLRIAANAFVLLEDTDVAARQRHEGFVASRDRELIRYFRTAMDESGAAVWAGLAEEKMVDSNAGFDASLIGSANTIARRLGELERAGVDILMCQFEDVEKELPRFAELASSSLRGGVHKEEVARCEHDS